MKRVVWLSIVLCLVSLISFTPNEVRQLADGVGLFSPRPIFASSTVRFLYDGDGARVAKIEEGKTTLYVGDWEKDLSTGQITKYYGLGGKRIAIKEGSNLSFLVSDHLGSLRTLSSLGNLNGSSIAKVSYYPYGSVRTKSDNLPSRQYTGQINDEQTGLYFYNARYYNPQIGVFTSPDQKISSNRYAYVNANPLNQTDPSGNEPEKPPMTIFVLKELAKSQYGVTFLDTTLAKWNIQEVSSTLKVLDRFPPSAYNGITFKREIWPNIRMQGAEGWIDVKSPDIVHISPNPFSSIKKGPPETPTPYKFYKQYNPSFEWSLAHELVHSMTFKYGYKKAAEEFVEDITAMGGSVSKPVSGVWSYDFQKGKEFPGNLWAGMNIFETIAEYGAYYYLSYGSLYNQDDFGNLDYYPYQFMSDWDKKWRNTSSNSYNSDSLLNSTLTPF